MALANREAITTFDSAESVGAAIELDQELEAKAQAARLRPTRYNVGGVNHLGVRFRPTSACFMLAIVDVYSSPDKQTCPGVVQTVPS